jgi:hypothetical protein
MSTQYIGFDGDQKRQIQRANVQAGSAIVYALDMSFHQNEIFSLVMRKYFGNGPNVSSTVMAVLNSMVIAVRQGTYDLRMATASGGTLASAETMGSAKGGYSKSKVGGKNVYHKPYIAKSQKEAKNGTKNMIDIMPSFFTLPFKGKDEDTQVETIVHELSHHAANTNDESVSGVDCYSYNGVQAAVRAGKATNNAENYGYFICSFQNFA